MQTSKKFWMGACASVVAVCGSLAWRAVAADSFQSKPSPVHVEMPAAKSLNLFLLGSDPSAALEAVGEVPAQAEKMFGSAAEQTTNWTGGAFSGDLSVGASLAVGGTSTFAGPQTFTGLVSGGTMLQSFAVSSTFSSSATSTPCAVQNTSGRTLTLLSASFDVPATNSTGTVIVNAGTSTSAYATSTSPLVATTVAQGWIPRITTTSSLQTVQAAWFANDWLVFKSSTTTNVGGGTCRAVAI